MYIQKCIINDEHAFDRKIQFQLYQNQNIYFQQQSNLKRKRGYRTGFESILHYILKTTFVSDIAYRLYFISFCVCGGTCFKMVHTNPYIIFLSVYQQQSSMFKQTNRISASSDFRVFWFPVNARCIHAPLIAYNISIASSCQNQLQKMYDAQIKLHFKPQIFSLGENSRSLFHKITTLRL